MDKQIGRGAELRSRWRGERALALAEKGTVWILFAALGALLGSATLAFDARPFGIALCGAAGTLFPAVALGVSVFAVITRDYLSVAALGVLAICRLVVSFFPLEKGGARPQVFGEKIGFRVLASSISMFTIGVYALCRSNFRLYFLFGLLVSVTVAPLACSLLSGLFFESSQPRPYVKEIGLATLLLLGVFAMREVSFMGIYPAAVAAALIAFWLSAHRGVLTGAVGGLLAGLAFSPVSAPAFLLCGAGFGLLEKSSRGGGILTGGGLAVLYTLAVSGVEGVTALLPAWLTAGALFLACDSAGLVEGSPVQRLSLWRARAARQAAESMALSYQEARVEALGEAMTSLSGVLYELGGGGRRPSVASLKHLCDREFDRVCPTCQHRDICWGSEYAATAEAVGCLASTLHSTGSADRAALPDALGARCRALPSILEGINAGAEYLCEEALRGDKTSVVAADYAAMGRVLHELLESGREAHRADSAMGERIASRLRRIGYTLDSVVVCGETHRRVLLRGLRLPGRHVKLRELREVIEGCCHFPLGEAHTREADGVPDLLFYERATLRATTVKQTRAMAGGRYCGDSVMSFSTDQGIEYAFLCDGMGSGNGAALCSALATTVLSALLRAGNRADTSLRMLGSVLAARGRRQNEASTTVDLLEVDLVSGEASLIKCGAAPTYLLRRGRTTRFFSRTAPVGILEVLDAERLRFAVEPGDVIVQVSDGVTGGEEDCPWLADMLVTRFDGDAERFASHVLARAGEEGRDDLSILVTEIAEASATRAS